METANTFPVGAVAIYDCVDGFTPAQGETTVNCLETGMWEQLSYICLPGNVFWCCQNILTFVHKNRGYDNIQFFCLKKV